MARESEKLTSTALADLKARILSEWYSNGQAILVEALGEILALEEITRQQRVEILRLDSELKVEKNQSEILARRNCMLIVELEQLKTALGLGTGDEHGHKSGGLE